ncbi:ATP-binding protein [Chloroflexota bacterium]
MSITAMPVLLQVSEIVNNLAYSLAYALLLLLAATACLGMAWGEWRRAHRFQTQRLLFAAIGLVLVRLPYIVVALVATSRSQSLQALLPPIERFADTASVALLCWAFMPPGKPRVGAWDLVFAANLALAAVACVGFTVIWSQVWTSNPALDYNVYWQATVWSIWQVGLILLALVWLLQSRGAGWGPMTLAMGLMLLGQVMQLGVPQAAAIPSVPIWERWANMVAYPLATIAFYQRTVADLRLRGRQWQELGEASLDQNKSLLDLFEASRRMSSSLDSSLVLENAVRAVARALDADQCAIAFPSEHDPEQMRLEAIYNPMRRARRDVATFPLEYQLAVQQAMRRKMYVIVDAADNVQIRALFALMGSSQTGPLLVLPLLSSGEPMGVMIVGNGQSRRQFAASDVKLCQAMAGQVVTAIQNSRCHLIAQDRIAELTKVQTGVLRTSQVAETQVQELTERLTSTEREIEILRQARDALEIKLVSSRVETDTLSKRLAILEADWEQPDQAGAERSKLEEVAALAEELRPPMTTIIGYADLLLSEAMGSVGEVQRKFLLRIKADAERMVQMINDLSLEAGGEGRWSHVQRQSVQVSTLVKGAVADSTGQIEDKTLTLDVQLPDDLPAVEADLDQVQRVLSCLLSNACLASPVGGRIELLAARSPSNGDPLERELLDTGINGFVTISVRDFGGGLPDDGLGQVFERTRPSQTPLGLGESGAGLAQVRMLVEAHGGHLWVESEDGVGTTFSFVLPIDEQQDRAPIDQTLRERDVAIAG